MLMELQLIYGKSFQPSVTIRLHFVIVNLVTGVVKHYEYSFCLLVEASDHVYV